MKFLKSLALILLASVIFTACKKDKNDAALAAPFIGKWTGSYGFNGDAPAYFFSLQIKSDGVIQELNSSGVAKGEGQWTIQGKTLKGTYKMLFSPYNEYAVSAVINASTGKMEGSWGFDKNAENGGKILLAKQ